MYCVPVPALHAPAVASAAPLAARQTREHVSLIHMDAHGTWLSTAVHYAAGISLDSIRNASATANTQPQDASRAAGFLSPQ